MASIEKRENNRGTSWRVIWYDPSGHKKSKTWTTEDRAELWKNLIEAVNGDADAAVRTLAAQSSEAMTVQQVAEHRMGLIRAAAFTIQTYESYMKNHIGPAFGSRPIDTITEDDCRRFIMALERKNLSPKYIHNIAGWLTSVMGHAADRGWREGNPMKPEMLPEQTISDEQEEAKFLTRDEAGAIIERMPQKYQLPAFLLLATGMRPQEMRALKVSDVHLDAKQPVVRVTKAIKQDRKNGAKVGTTKSRSGNRSIGLPRRSVVPLLAAHVKDRAGDEYLFPGRDGRWIPAETFYGAFKKGVRRAQADKKLTKNPGPYALRHTHASLMIDQGMDIYKLSKHLGHSHVSVTESTYLHLYPTAVFEAAEMAEIAIGALPLLAAR